MKKFGSAFLHIGFDKTGSTAIQEALDRSRDFLLKEEEIAYLSGTRHAELGSYFCNNPEDFILNREHQIDEDQKYTSEAENLLRSIAEINILMKRDRPTRSNQVHLDKRKTILVRLKQYRNKFVDTHVKD